ncbi:MAG: hypothetical protein ACR2JY_13195 [Chloroflexota bacterium]
MRLQRSIVILLVGAVGLMLAGVVVAILTSRQPAATFPAGSPAAAVATYLRLLQNGQVDEAYAMTAFDQPTMTRERYHEQFDHWSQQPHRVTLLRTTVTGDQATVTVETSTFRPSLFGAADATAQQAIILVRRQGNWLISGPEYLKL